MKITISFGICKTLYHNSSYLSLIRKIQWQKQSCRAELFCKKACNFIKKETLAQVFSCECCEISKSTYFHRAPLAAASSMTKFNQEKQEKRTDKHPLSILHWKIRIYIKFKSKMHAHKQWHCYNFHWSLYFTVYINYKSHTAADAWDNFYCACEREKWCWCVCLTHNAWDLVGM